MNKHDLILAYLTNHFDIKQMTFQDFIEKYHQLEDVLDLEIKKDKQNTFDKFFR